MIIFFAATVYAFNESKLNLDFLYKPTKFIGYAYTSNISGVLGALLVIKARYLLPYLLAFAAGAMIYVVVEELIPESQTNKKKDVMAFFTLIGFMIMMVMDVALG